MRRGRPPGPAARRAPPSPSRADPGLADDAGYSIAWGCCGHVFHLDCISRWLKTRSVCPLCNREWEFAKIEKIATCAAAAPAQPRADRAPLSPTRVRPCSQVWKPGLSRRVLACGRAAERGA